MAKRRKDSREGPTLFDRGGLAPLDPPSGDSTAKVPEPVRGPEAAVPSGGSTPLDPPEKVGITTPQSPALSPPGWLDPSDCPESRRVALMAGNLRRARGEAIPICWLPEPSPLHKE
jgi:hypothetical protein